MHTQINLKSKTKKNTYTLTDKTKQNCPYQKRTIFKLERKLSHNCLCDKFHCQVCQGFIYVKWTISFHWSQTHDPLVSPDCWVYMHVSPDSTSLWFLVLRHMHLIFLQNMRNRRGEEMKCNKPHVCVKSYQIHRRRQVELYGFQTSQSYMARPLNRTCTELLPFVMGSSTEWCTDDISEELK